MSVICGITETVHALAKLAVQCDNQIGLSKMVSAHSFELRAQECMIIFKWAHHMIILAGICPLCHNWILVSIFRKFPKLTRIHLYCVVLQKCSLSLACKPQPLITWQRERKYSGLNQAKYTLLGSKYPTFEEDILIKNVILLFLAK